MEELIELLKDGRARTIELLAVELHTTVSDIERKIEYLEQMGIIKRVSFQMKSCSSCPSHAGKKGSAPCKGCIPKEGFKGMGEMWQIVNIHGS